MYSEYNYVDKPPSAADNTLLVATAFFVFILELECSFY